MKVKIKINKDEKGGGKASKAKKPVKKGRPARKAVVSDDDDNSDEEDKKKQSDSVSEHAKANICFCFSGMTRVIAVDVDFLFEFWNVYEVVISWVSENSIAMYI